MLKPVDLACLQILRHFWHVARRGKGGRMVDGVPWIRVTAADMVGYFAREGVVVSEVTVSRSLRRLELASRCQRRQLFLSRWDHRYWYAPSSRDDQNDHSGDSESDPPLEVSYSNQKSKAVSQVSPELSEGRPVIEGAEAEISAPPSGHLEDRGVTSFSQDDGIHRPSVGGSPGGSGRPQVGDKGISSTWERVRVLAGQFDPAQVASVSPRLVVVEGRLMKVDDGDYGPLR